MSIKGIVFDIQRFSLHDGPGIRTTVFMKGCPLRCIWCQNPESWQMRPQVMLKKDRSLRTAGYEADVDAVLREVEKDSDYYENTGGGLTISGGEPLLQYEFTLELLKAAKAKGLHTCIETCGYSEQDKYAEAMKHTDLFLYDIKASDSKVHKELTGVGNETIHSNLDFLYKSGAAIIIRCPMVPGKNDSLEHFEGIAAFEVKYPLLRGIEILPFHNMGRGKWEEIGERYLLGDLESTGEETKNKWRERFRKLECSKAVIV